MAAFRTLFGPVPSRRLGLSLGVDLVPPKTCTLDCVYCEAGRTTELTTVRAEYVSTEEILRELEAFLSSGPTLDVVTFSGAGEPTLHSGIGRIIRYMKERWGKYRLALITNGTLLHLPALRAELAGLDLILPSLDAVSPQVFARINRPVSGLAPQMLVDGLRAFRQQNPAEMWLEVFLASGVNDTPEELELLRQAISFIGPHRVQLNTLDRPGSEPWVRPIPRERLEEIVRQWAPLPVEIIARVKSLSSVMETGDLAAAVLSLVERRPCTLQDLVMGLGASETDVNIALKGLLHERRIEAVPGERGSFFRPL